MKGERLTESPVNAQSVCNISLINSSIKKSHSLVTMGKVSNCTASIMIDTGATTNFVNLQFCQRNRLKLVHITKQRVGMADNHIIVADKGLIGTFLEVFGKRTQENFVAVEGLKHAAILGMPWLQHSQAVIDFEHREISFKVGKFPKLLDVLKTTDLITTKTEKGDELFNLHIRQIPETADAQDIGAQNVCKLTQKILKEFSDVFQEELPDGLPPRRGEDHKIILKEGHKPHTRAPPRMSPAELTQLRKTIDELLRKGFIRPSSSPFGAPITFAKKKNGELRMCVNYRVLNSSTVRNEARSDEIFDQIKGAKVFSKLDLCSGYYQVRINDADIEKTAFRCRYGHFEFQVMPFGLTGAPSTFMRIMNEVLHPYLDTFVSAYLDDILVYSKSNSEHYDHLRKVLERLRIHKLYAKPSKCELFKKEVKFLGHMLSSEGIQMEKEKVQAILDYPKPNSVHEVRAFLGFVGFYRKFIANFAKIARPLTDLTRTKSKTKFEWNREAEMSYNKLKKLIQTAPMLHAPDETKPFWLNTDASDFAIGAVLSQKDDEDVLRPLAFYSAKLKGAEIRYPTHEKELLAIIKALKNFRSYIYGRPINVQTDHKTLQYFTTQPKLSLRQARWAELMADYNLNIGYHPGKMNVVADYLSRRPDWRSVQDVQGKEENEQCCEVIELIPKTCEETAERIKSCQLNDESCKKLLEDKSLLTNQKLREENGILYQGSRMFVPDDNELKHAILEKFHDSPMSGHGGIKKTLELISRDFWWSNMTKDIEDYIRGCERCQKTKAVQLKPGGLLFPHIIPQSPWAEISMDFITHLPKSQNGNDSILVIVDKLTKYLHCFAIKEKISSQETAALFFERIVTLHGLPSKIISDRDTRFTSNFWRELMRIVGVQQNMSTSFHPQTDGQSERMNRIIEDTLRCYIQRQNEWEKWLPYVEIAINNSQSSTTGQSPYFANYGFHPQFKGVRQIEERESNVPKAAQFVNNIQRNIEEIKIHMRAAIDRQKAYANLKRRELVFAEGDLVKLNTRNIPVTVGVRKLTDRFIGPFKIEKKVSDVAYKLKLPTSFRIHPVFHISQLEPVKKSKLFSREEENITVPAEGGVNDEFEIERILGERKRYRRKEYLERFPFGGK